MGNALLTSKCSARSAKTNFIFILILLIILHLHRSLKPCPAHADELFAKSQRGEPLFSTV